MLNTTRVIGRALDSAPDDVTGQCSGPPICADQHERRSRESRCDGRSQSHEAGGSQDLSRVAGEEID
jgi:hypothetical protein